MLLSLLGRFCVYEFNTKKILYGTCKNKGRGRLTADGITLDIEGLCNYDGSSKGIASSGYISILIL